MQTAAAYPIQPPWQTSLRAYSQDAHSGMG